MEGFAPDHKNVNIQSFSYLLKVLLDKLKEILYILVF